MSVCRIAFNFQPSFAGRKQSNAKARIFPFLETLAINIQYFKRLCDTQYMYTNIYSYIYIYVYTQNNIYIYICTYIQNNIYMYIYIYISMYIHRITYMYTYVCVYIYIYTYIHIIYTYIYISSGRSRSIHVFDMIAHCTENMSMVGLHCDLAHLIISLQA